MGVGDGVHRDVSQADQNVEGMSMSERPLKLAIKMYLTAEIIKDEEAQDHHEAANRYAAILQNMVNRFLEAKEDG